jgi:ubiquinone/menaquinone biosynthesis C-methylase UbiE
VSSVSFDRAASYYDATRGLPVEIRLSLAQMLAGELAGRGTCFEIGVGTGRIALPLHDIGIPMMGSDISAGMLQRLVANTSGESIPQAPRTEPGRPPHPPFPLIRADATDLPLAVASVGAVMASHVLHLIPAWRRAVEEAIRVLRPGGVLLADFGGSAPTPWSSETLALFEAHGIRHIRPGVSGPEPLAEYLGSRVAVRPLPAIEMKSHRSLQQDLADWEHQIHAWTWPYTADQMGRACQAIRDRALKQEWAIDTAVELTRTIQWWAYDLTDTPH